VNEFDLARFPGSLATDALAGDDTVTLSETQNVGVLFAGNAGGDTITGSSQGDRIRSDAGSDRLLGADGHDKLRGNGGRDRIEGGFGDDTIHGGDGDDRIVGQWGSNQLWGGEGADTFVCGGSPGLETVHDFEVGLDKVEVRANGLEVVVFVSDEETSITLQGTGRIVRLLGVQADPDDVIVL
jgi:Ca2+-binding RTX toxin-like protein